MSLSLWGTRRRKAVREGQKVENKDPQDLLLESVLCGCQFDMTHSPGFTSYSVVSLHGK